MARSVARCAAPIGSTIPAKSARNPDYLHRAVDSGRETIEFMLPFQRNLIAAKLFLRVVLSGGGLFALGISVHGHPACASTFPG